MLSYVGTTAAGAARLVDGAAQNRGRIEVNLIRVCKQFIKTLYMYIYVYHVHM